LADLRAINPALDILVVSHGEVDAAALFSRSTPAAVHNDAHADDAAHDHTHHHAAHDETHPVHHHHSGVESWSARIDRPLAWDRLRDWMAMVYSLRAPHILRMKGIFWLGESAQPVVMHGVAGLVSEPTTLAAWPDNKPESQIVFITKSLKAALLEESFAAHVLAPAEPVATHGGAHGL
jgi:G3E family GTPase